jgi:hypothetical protein
MYLARVSPDGSAIRLEDEKQFHVVDTQHLQDIAFCSVTGKIESVSSSRAIKVEGRRVLVQNYCSEWHPIFRLEDEPGCLTVHGDFVSNERLLITSCHALTLIDMTGKVISRTEFPPKHPAHGLNGTTIRPAAQSDRYAVETLDLGGLEIPDLDMYYHVAGVRIRVLGDHLNRSLGELEVKGLPRSPFDFDLSPDGDMLACLIDHKVKAYAVGAVKKNSQ